MKSLLCLFAALGASIAFGAKDFGDFYTRAWYLVVVISFRRS